MADDLDEEWWLNEPNDHKGTHLDLFSLLIVLSQIFVPVKVGVRSVLT